MTPSRETPDEGNAQSSTADERCRVYQDDGGEHYRTSRAGVTPELLEGLTNGTLPREVAASVTQCLKCDGTGCDSAYAKTCSECEGRGSRPDANDDLGYDIKVCLKCNGRGFTLSKKHRCPACNAYEMVVNVPADTLAADKLDHKASVRGKSKACKYTKARVSKTRPRKLTLFQPPTHIPTHAQPTMMIWSLFKNAVFVQERREYPAYRREPKKHNAAKVAALYEAKRDIVDAEKRP